MHMTNETLPEYTLLPLNSWLFQIANCLLLISYMMTNVLYLRILLACASTFFVLWGTIILHYSIDTILWNSAFMCINVGHIINLLYARRTLEFDNDKQFVWEHIFYRYLSMDRLTFKTLTDDCETINLRVGDFYAVQGNLVDTLAVIVEGEIEVLQVVDSIDFTDKNADKNRLLINRLRPLDFVNSPEWTWGYDRYDVDLRCATTVRLIVWPFVTLKKLQQNNPALRGLMNGALARDIATKLLTLQKLWRQDKDTNITSGRIQNEDADDYRNLMKDYANKLNRRQSKRKRQKKVKRIKQVDMTESSAESFTSSETEPIQQ